MRILQLAKYASSRADNGGKLRTYGLGLALSGFAEVDLVGFGDEAPDVLRGTPRSSHYRNCHSVEMEHGWRRAAAIAAGFAQGQALRSSRFASAAFRRRVGELLSSGAYDAVQVEELSMMVNLPPEAAAIPLVYSAHNVESALSPQLFRGRAGIAALAAQEARRTQAEERRALARARFCLTVSAADKEALLRLAPSAEDRIHVVPNCVFDDVTPGPPRGRTEPMEIVTIGCLAWRPNEQGARWFVSEVLPLLRRRTRCVVRFVGSGIAPALGDELAAAGCEVSADADDVLPHLHRARAVFVPLHVGGGTRLKIVEAWAAGVPVVSTPVGAEGLDGIDGAEILLASDAESFSRALVRLIEDDELYGRLRDNGLRRAASLRWSGQAALLRNLYGQP